MDFNKVCAYLIERLEHTASCQMVGHGSLPLRMHVGSDGKLHPDKLCCLRAAVPVAVGTVIVGLRLERRIIPVKRGVG